MLGARGVGKTSLLAAMYDQFDNVSQDLQLVAHESSESELNSRLKELKSVVESRSIKIQNNVTQTKSDVRSFQFDFGETGTAPSLTINFRDYPGGWLQDNKEEVKKLIRESAAVVIPIETPALMEKGGKYHNEFNRPDELNHLFKNVYKDLDSPRLVIFVPVKCEKYVQNTSELFKATKEGYNKLLNQLSGNKLLSKVAVVIAPVETIGGIKYSRVEKDEDGQPIFYYRKPQPNDRYQPRNTEIPLKYLLRFLLKLHLENKRSSSVFFRIISSFGTPIQK